MYLFRDDAGRVLYVGKSISIRSRARAHFAPSSVPADWTVAGHGRRLPEHELRARRARAREPPDQAAPPARQHPPGAERTTGSATSAAGSTSRSRSSRSRPSRRPGTRVTIGPLRGRRLAHELVEQLDSLFGLRHCGRRLRAPRASVRVRADGALPVAVPRATSTRTSTGAGSTRRCGCSSAEADGREPPARRTSGRRCARPRRSSSYERAAWLRRRLRPARRDPRAARRRARGDARASRGCSSPRTPSTPTGGTRSGSSAAGSSTGGRRRRPAERSRSARRRRSGVAGAPASSGAHVPPDEIDELRIVVDLPGLAPRDAAARARAEPARRRLVAALSRNGSSTTSAVSPPPSPTATTVPGGASRRTSAERDRAERAATARRSRAGRPRARRTRSSVAGRRPAPTAAARAAAGSACRGRTGGRRSPARRSSPW